MGVLYKVAVSWKWSIASFHLVLNCFTKEVNLLLKRGKLRHRSTKSLVQGRMCWSVAELRMKVGLESGFNVLHSLSMSIFKAYFAQVMKKTTRLPHLTATEDAAPFPFQFLSGNVILLCHPQAATTLLKNICRLHGEPVIKC